MTLVKVCGVTGLEDALACADAGVDALGLNFWPGSPRQVEVPVARRIVEVLGARVRIVGLFVDAGLEEIRALRAQVGFHCAQLHGDEAPALVAQLLPGAFKALRVRDASVREQAARYPGDYILLDAYVPGQVGGTGATFNWRWARAVAVERRVVLAGGLTSENVAQAVTEVRPYAVDTASGVESAPGRKDPRKVVAFVDAVRRAVS